MVASPAAERGTRLHAVPDAPDPAEPDPAESDPVEFRTIHGCRRAFRQAGQGPPMLLLHGLGDSSAAWAVLLPELARTHRVIAPDLLGHGCSDTPRGDYSIPAHANDLRDLLGALRIRRATVIGHSLGGGLAMQLAYQFPHLVDRLVLVAPGGVTRDVHQLLRLMALPGGDKLLALVQVPAVRAALRRSGRSLVAALRRTGVEIPDITGALDALSRPGQQRAFLRTLRSVVDWQGQVMCMLDRNQLPDGLPVLLVWGNRDPIIPVAHAELARQAIPGSRLEVFPGAGHFPHRTDPARFLAVVRDFLPSTPVARRHRSGERCLTPTEGSELCPPSASRRRHAQLQPLVEPQPSQT